MKKIFLSRLFWFIAVCSIQNAGATELLKQLAETPSAQGKFIQSRQLKNISFELKSSGQVTYLKNIGIYNETQAPIFQAISFSKQGIQEWDKQGNAITTQQSKADLFVSKLLLALFNGNQTELVGLFDIIDAESKNSEWQLQLLPRNELIAEHITSIQLKADKSIEEILIRTAQGDKTLIQFSSFQPLDETTALNFCKKFPESAIAPCDS